MGEERRHHRLLTFRTDIDEPQVYSRLWTRVATKLRLSAASVSLRELGTLSSECREVRVEDRR